MLTIGSLFSGIGGLELGLEWAGLGPTLWHVEREKFCQCVLRHHWPLAELHDDVCTVGKSNLAPVDLICGGFPCQDVSPAGTRTGLAGGRSGLWREYARIVEELAPSWVVVENVAGGASQWLDTVIGELDKLGYDCLPVPLSARDVGAPHLRERIFVVANAHGVSARQLGRGEPGPGEAVASDDGALRSFAPNVNSVPGITRPSGTRTRGAGRPMLDGGAHANPDHPRREGSGPGEEIEDRTRLARHAGWSSEPGVVPLVHGLSGGMAGRRRRARIRAEGNAVVPQDAEVIGWVIRELAGLTEAA